MANNPLFRYGPPRAAGITCTLGISGEFPDYTSGLAYTGTVSINGAQGATRVELVPPGTDANGGAYIPLENADFAAGSTSWVAGVIGSSTPASPGFTFQPGAGRSGDGFLRWETSGPMGPSDEDVIYNTQLVQATSTELTGRIWARCTSIGATSEYAYAQATVEMQVFDDAAATNQVGRLVIGTLRFFEVLDWRPIVSTRQGVAGKYVRFAVSVSSGVAATIEFDDAEWDARGIPSSPPAALALPAGFTIDTQLSPDRVRVQWPATATPGTSTLPNLGFESGDASYIKGADWAISTGGLVESGTQSAKFTGIGQSTLAHETLAPVTAGTSITASARISKGNNRQDFAGGAVVLQWFDNTLASLGFNVGNVVNTGTSAFQTSSVTANAPTGAAYVRLAASATRDVKGRATDAVTVDTLTWNHVFTLGGTGETGGTAPTGPVALTFRVTDSNGCQAVATRTIGEAPPSSGTWAFFGRTTAPDTGFFATTGTHTSVSLSGRSSLATGGDVRGGGVFSGVFSALFGGASNSFIRSTAATGPYTYPVLAGNPGTQSKIVHSGTRLVTIGGVRAQFSTDNGATWTATSGFFNFRVIAANSSGRLVAFRSVFTQVATSTNGGDSWADVANISETTAGGIYDVVSDGSQFLLVYLDGPANVKCTRGNSSASSWEAPVTLPFTAPAASVGFVAVNAVGGVLVVTSTGQASYSSNFGTTWSAVTSTGLSIVRSVSFGDGVFVVTGEATGGDLAAAAYSSDNGATWARATVTGATDVDRLTYAQFFPA